MDIALRDGMKPNAYYVAAESFTGDLAYTRWTLRTEAERAAHNAIACGMKLATVFDSATHGVPVPSRPSRVRRHA
jgi:hypothetical protein